MLAVRNPAILTKLSKHRILLTTPCNQLLFHQRVFGKGRPPSTGTQRMLCCLIPAAPARQPPHQEHARRPTPCSIPLRYIAIRHTPAEQEKNIQSNPFKLPVSRQVAICCRSTNNMHPDEETTGVGFTVLKTHCCQVKLPMPYTRSSLERL